MSDWVIWYFDLNWWNDKLYGYNLLNEFCQIGICIWLCLKLGKDWTKVLEVRTIGF